MPKFLCRSKFIRLNSQLNVYDLKSICNDPNQMKEKWQVFCPEHTEKFANPQMFYKKIGNPHWIHAKRCGLEPV